MHVGKLIRWVSLVLLFRSEAILSAPLRPSMATIRAVAVDIANQETDDVGEFLIKAFTSAVKGKAGEVQEVTAQDFGTTKVPGAFTGLVSGKSVELSTEEILRTGLISFFDQVMEKLKDQGLLEEPPTERPCPTLTSVTDTLRVILTHCVKGDSPQQIAEALGGEEDAQDQGSSVTAASQDGTILLSASVCNLYF